VIGQKTRAEVHSNQLLHRAVHVFVFNKRGQLLLQQRSMLKDAHPGVWDSSVSGHLDSGESYDSAAARELMEEMNILTETPAVEITRISPCEETGWEHVRLYRTRHDGSLRYPAAEIKTATWFPIEEIDAWTTARPTDFASGFIACWKTARHLI
jgi:16S rRNA (adenine1518-N6/adenine1519-N6)-dimethyltransferase